MLTRHKLLLLIPAILLIPILFGMIPLNMAHKLASGGPFTHCKQVQSSNHCPFNSVVSHDDLTNVSLNSTPLFLGLPSIEESQISLSDSVQSNITFNSIPLRC
jgi:hypothetical protein